MDALTAHHTQLAGPKGIPCRIVVGVGNAGVETGLPEAPAFRSTDRSSQTLDIVIRVGVAERLANGVVKSMKAMASLSRGSAGTELSLK